MNVSPSKSSAIVVSLLFEMLTAAHCMATPHQEAAIRFLDAINFDGRLKDHLTLPRTGIPDVDKFFEQANGLPEIQFRRFNQ